MRRYWNEIKTAWVQGNLWTRLSLLVMGSGYFACDRWGKGILMTLMEVFFFLFTGRVSWQYIRKLNTLGTVQRKETLDLTTLQKTVNHYDNSLLILLFGVVGILIIAAFVALYVSNFKTVFRMQQMKEHGEHINTMKEDKPEVSCEPAGTAGFGGNSGKCDSDYLYDMCCIYQL